MIPLSGTFEYAFVLPEHPERRGRWPGRLGPSPQMPFISRGDNTRLVGHAPTLEIVEAGETPGMRSSPFTGHSRPKLPLSRFVLRAEARDHAQYDAFSFCIDRALTNMFRGGDELHMTRTASGGLGLSVIRAGQLLAASGAAAAVPLGDRVRVQSPDEQLRAAADVFRKIDPAFSFRELPIDVCIGTARRVLFNGRLQIGAYQVFVEHGAYPGVPGTDACLAISLIGTCPDVSAIATAQLLEYGDLCEFVRDA